MPKHAVTKHISGLKCNFVRPSHSSDWFMCSYRINFFILVLSRENLFFLIFVGCLMFYLVWSIFTMWYYHSSVTSELGMLLDLDKYICLLCKLQHIHSDIFKICKTANHSISVTVLVFLFRTLLSNPILPVYIHPYNEGSLSMVIYLLPPCSSMQIQYTVLLTGHCVRGSPASKFIYSTFQLFLK